MRRLAALLVSVVLLAGCSTISIVYNRAEFALSWIADDYFDLTSEQKAALATDLRRWHDWHRKHELPRYAALLEDLDRRIARGLVEGDVLWALDAAKGAYAAFVEYGHADAARRLATLTPGQLEAARRAFEKSNRRYAEENGLGAPVETQRRLRFERQVERLEDLVGRLRPDQLAKLEKLSHALPLTTAERHQYRVQRQRSFLALLEQRRTDPGFAAALADWMLGWERARTADYEALHRRHIAANAAMYVEFAKTLDVSQRRHLSERLQRYASAFRDLAAAGRHAVVQPCAAAWCAEGGL